LGVKNNKAMTFTELLQRFKNLQPHEKLEVINIYDKLISADKHENGVEIPYNEMKDILYMRGELGKLHPIKKLNN
jgi:hypothetical protein